jgi:hypothetical protein
MQALIAAYQRWYNERRPHEALGNRTPAEIRDGVTARPNRRFELRASYPLARGDPSVRHVKKLELRVEYIDGFRELPIVELREAA